eukprot:6196541-Pleurochrysis_carterae.AAC.8
MGVAVYLSAAFRKAALISSWDAPRLTPRTAQGSEEVLSHLALGQMALSGIHDSRLLGDVATLKPEAPIADERVESGLNCKTCSSYNGLRGR